MLKYGHYIEKLNSPFYDIEKEKLQLGINYWLGFDVDVKTSYCNKKLLLTLRKKWIYCQFVSYSLIYIIIYNKGVELTLL